MSRRNVSWIIGANVKNFEQGMKRVEARLKDVGRQTTWMGRDLQRSITMPFLAASASVIAMAHNTAQYADRISDLSDVTGISTDALQEWDFVANRVGVTTEVISGAFGSLGRRMSQFQRGSGPAVDAARQLGVEFRNADGTIRNADNILMDIIGRLNDMPADLDRAGIGTALFGRRWETLAPIIGRGIDNIQQIRQEAQDLGLVLSGESLEAANKFREEMVKFSAQMKAAGHNLALDFMPVILEFLPVATEMAQGAISIAEAFSKLDTETQKNRIQTAAYAAALGPLLVVLGSTAVAIEKLFKLFRLVIFNPKTAGIVGLIAYMTKLAIETGLAANNTLRLREEMDKLISGSVQANDFERLNELIVEQEKAIEKAEMSFNRYGAGSKVATDAMLRQLDDMRDKLEDLVLQRDQAALAFHDDIISQRSVDNSEKVKENIAEAARSAGVLRFQIDPPDENIFDPSDEIDKMLAAEFMAKELERWQFLIGGAEDYSHRLVLVNEEQSKMTRSLDDFGHLGAQVLDRMIFQSEKLSSVWKSLGRQFATRGFLTLLTGGFGASSGGFLGGLGKIIGIQDGIISPRGDIITTHPDDYLIATKDPGAIVGNIQSAASGKLTARTPIIIEIDGRAVFHAMKEVEYQMR